MRGLYPRDRNGDDLRAGLPGGEPVRPPAAAGRSTPAPRAWSGGGRRRACPCRRPRSPPSAISCARSSPSSSAAWSAGSRPWRRRRQADMAAIGAGTMRVAALARDVAARGRRDRPGPGQDPGARDRTRPRPRGRHREPRDAPGPRRGPCRSARQPPGPAAGRVPCGRPRRRGPGGRARRPARQPEGGRGRPRPDAGGPAGGAPCGRQAGIERENADLRRRIVGRRRRAHEPGPDAAGRLSGSAARARLSRCRVRSGPSRREPGPETCDDRLVSTTQRHHRSRGPFPHVSRSQMVRIPMRLKPIVLAARGGLCPDACRPRRSRRSAATKP